MNKLKGRLKMGEVRDFFTGSRMDDLVKQNNKENDGIVSQFGRYVGVLPQFKSDSLRNKMNYMSQKRTQLIALQSEYQMLCDDYEETLLDVSKFLEIPYNQAAPLTHDFYIDSKGHCWIVKIEDRVNLERDKD